MQRTLTNKRFRVVARKTDYYYIDVEAHSKAEAREIATNSKQELFTVMKNPQDEFKVLSATHLGRSEPVDELKFLTR